LKDLCPHSRKRAGFVFFSPPHTVRVCFLRHVPRLSLSKPQLRNFLSVFLCILSNSPHIFLFQINQAPCQAARFHHYSTSLSLSRACALSFFLSLSLYLWQIYISIYSKAMYEDVWRRLRKRARENASNVEHRGPVSLPLTLLLLTIRQSIRKLMTRYWCLLF
jgi:hypothetical protein